MSNIINPDQTHSMRPKPQRPKKRTNKSKGKEEITIKIDAKPPSDQQNMALTKAKPRKNNVNNMKFGMGSALYSMIRNCVLTMDDPCGSQGKIPDTRIPDGSVAISGDLNTRDVEVSSAPPVVDVTPVIKANKQLRDFLDSYEDLLMADDKILDNHMAKLGFAGFQLPLQKSVLRALRKYASLMQDPVPLDGSLISYCYLGIQGFRINHIVLCLLDGGSFGKPEQIDFANAWNNLTNFDEALHPNWFPTDNPKLWFQIQLNPAFINLALPPTERTSEDIVQWRTNSSGDELFLNAPELINQGVYVMGQVPGNYTHVNPTGSSSPVANIVATLILNGTAITRRTLSWGIGPTTIIDTIDVNQSGFVNRIVKLDVRIRDPDNLSRLIDFASTGDELTITMSNQIFVINNPTTSQTLSVIVPGLSGNGTAVVQTYLGSNAYARLDESDFSLIQMPPTEESTLAQIDAKIGVGQLAKCNGGGRVMRANLHQPVMSWQTPTERRPIRFIVPGMNHLDVDNAAGGYPDSIDKNFNFTTTLLLNISSSARPIKKTIKTVELVAQPGSVYGPIMRPTQQPCPEAVEISRAIMDMTPHNFDADYNANGILSSKLDKILGMLLPVVGTGVGIAQRLTEVLGKVGL
jgi:hypothetical protein